MKKKIIYLIVIVSMVLTIGLLSVKKGYALDYVVQGTTNTANQNFFCAYSGNLPQYESYYLGASMPLETGNTIEELSIDVDDYCCYTFFDVYTNYDTLLINFYHDYQQNRTNIQYAIFEEDNIYSIQTDYILTDEVLFIFFCPGANGIDNNKVVAIRCHVNTTTDYLSLQHISDNVLIMVDENYYDGDYQYHSGLRRSNIQMNEIMTYSNGYDIGQFNYSGELFCNYFNTYRLDTMFSPQINSLIYGAFHGGYNDGYDDGLATGDYSTGYQNGLQIGRQLGYSIGYDDGYEDGENGENAIHPFWAMISQIGQGLSAIINIQLGPGITIGTLIFIPLFFAVLGLVLWIWRHN